jgi:hypothetical protein
MPGAGRTATARYRKSDHTVRTADGRTLRLSAGEYKAVQAWIGANGRTGYLTPPHDTTAAATARLVELGLIEWVKPGLARWCRGVLELDDPIDRAPALPVFQPPRQLDSPTQLG